MNKVSRRDVLASLAMAGASSLAGRADDELLAQGAKIVPKQPMSVAARKQAADVLVKYFGGTAPQLLRPAEGVLRHPSVAPSLPGKEYATSLWDWDTLWTSRGLFRYAAAGDPELHRRVGEHAQGSLLNFLDHQSEEGRIPIMMSVSNPDPFGCLKKRPAPNSQNQAKPVMGQLALLVADEMKDVAWLASRFDQLLRFYDSWTVDNKSSIGLLVWGNDVAIGNDNDPTTFGRPSFSSANLLLNCLYYQDLVAGGVLAGRLGRVGDGERLAGRARELGVAIQRYCWDERDRFYYTVDVQCVDRRAELIPDVKRGMAMSWSCLPLRMQVFTGFLPMWCGIATQEQAKDLVRLHYLNARSFHAEAGVRSLSREESMYSLEFSSNPSNWLGPVWIIVNYLVWAGLKRYGFAAEAKDLADKTLRLLADDVAKSGSLNEYYHPDTGAPLSHRGFMDWNLLVLEML